MSGFKNAHLCMIMAAVLVGCAAFTEGLGLIKWDPIKQVWIDLDTKGVVTVTSNSVTNPIAGTTTAVAPVATTSYTQQGETKPVKASSKDLYPFIMPDAEYFKTCFKNTSDSLSMATTKCDLFKDFVNCQQLAAMGYLPPGTQSFVPNALNGGFSLPNGCSSGQLGIEYDGIKMVFNSPQVPILAVIAKDVLSKVYYFGSGVLQGKLLNILMLKAEFCYAPPSISPLYVSKTATYSTGMQPGTAAWSFFKSVTLAPPFTNNMASMFRGDTADATWTLTAQKTGTDTVYQGAVSGQITISNPQNVPVTVYSVNDYVQGGPSSTVSCGSPVPFQIPPCSSSVCNSVAYWPLAPAAGTYTGLADVTYSVGDTGIQGNQVGQSIFQVGQISSAVGMMSTAAGTIASGSAIVQDAMAPQQYTFSGSTQQSYTTSLTCPTTEIITNQATLTASTGQQITQTATVQKLCFELQVRVAQAASPYVGKYKWDIKKEASTSSITLKPSATAWDKYLKQQMDLAIASGQDPTAALQLITGGNNMSTLSAAGMGGSATEEVTYRVTYTRTAPGGLVAGNPAFQTVGDVFITNTSPLNAQLKEVTVQISNPFGGLPYSTTATCPILTVAAGQTLQCRYVATPAFNPIGAQVTAAALYLNNRNGVPSGTTTPFTSPAILVAGGDAATGSGRKLMSAKTLNDPLSVLGSILKVNSSGPAPTVNLTHPLMGLGNFLSAISKLSNEVDDVEDDDTSGTTVAAGSTPAPMPQAPVVPATPPATTYDLQGLQDECVEVRDAFLKGSGYSTGIITSGTFPSGRICDTTTFTYTVSYGPFNECWEKKAVNQASFYAPDTKTRGEASAPVKVAVAGCGAAVAASTKTYAVWAKKSYTWTVGKIAQPAALSLTQGKAGTITYRISYKRVNTLVSPKLSATVQFDNLATASAATLSGFSYSVSSQCQAGVKQKTGTFKCAAQTIPAGGAPLTCQVQVDLPCPASGTFVATASVGNNIVQSTPFTFPAPQATDSLTDSECAIVTDEYASGDGYIAGAVASGIRPYGRLCGSKDFEYTASFGPFETCGRRKVSNVASFQTGNPSKTVSTESLVLVDVNGCNLYTPMTNISSGTASAKRTAKPAEKPAATSKATKAKATGGSQTKIYSNGRSAINCVSPVEFWKACMNSTNPAGRCAVINQLPAGPSTAFFPQPGQKATRTYKVVMIKSANTGNKSTDLWFKAAQALVSVQLNELAGVPLPDPVKEALSTISAAVGTSTTTPPVLQGTQSGLPAAISTLEKFSAGQAGVQTC